LQLAALNQQSLRPSRVIVQFSAAIFFVHRPTSL